MKLKSGVFSFFITGLILLFGFYLGGLFPFGEGTVSWCDMNQQAIPILCDFKDIITGKNGMFLNLANASGMNFYGVFFFFLSSPFSFLSLFVSKADIPFLMNVLVVLKLSLCAATEAYTFQKLFPKTGWALNCVLGVSYGLCGYGMLFYQNIMWLDVMYLFPVIVLGIYKLIKESKPLLLLFGLSACIVLNYYISFMVFLFVIFFFGIFAIFYRNADSRIYVNLGICGSISLCLTAVVWVPSFLQYTASARSTGIIHELKQGGFFAPTNTTLPIILLSGIIFASLIFSLFYNTARNKEKAFMLAVFSATVIPLFVEPVNLMWHTGSYMSFPARYGFIPVFLGLMIAAKELGEIEFSSKSRLSCFAVNLVITLGFSWVAVTFANKNSDALSSYVKTLWGNESSLKGITLICMFTVTAFLIALFSAKRGKVSRRAVAFLLCLVVAAQGLCSIRIYMVTAKNKLNLYDYQSFVKVAQTAQKDGFYRVNTKEKITDANMTGAAGFNSISHYTSLNDANTMEAMKQFGYSGYWMETGNWCGSIISDALLSVGYTVESANGKLLLRENPYYLGLGIKVDGKIEERLSNNDRLLTVGEAFSRLANSENPVKKYQHTTAQECIINYTDSATNVIPITEQNSLSYNLQIKEKERLYFDCYNGFSNNLTEEVNDGFAVYVNGELLDKSYPSQNYNGLLELGCFENQTVNITLKVLKDAKACSFGVFGVSEEKFGAAVEKLQSLNLNQKGGRISGKADKGKYFISIPYSENYKITLNGEKLEYSKALGGFLALEILEEGELEITAVPKGFWLSFAVSVLGVLLTIIFIIYRKKVSKLNESLCNVVFGMFFGVFVIAACLVYIMPTIIGIMFLLI